MSDDREKAKKKAVEEAREEGERLYNDGITNITSYMNKQFSKSLVYEGDDDIRKALDEGYKTAKDKDKENKAIKKIDERLIKSGNQKSTKTYSTCFYPTYQFLVDWNGDIFLCPQDWQRRVTMGNMMQDSLFNIWSGKIMTKFRKNLLKGKRCDSPCNACNAEGTLLGSKHAKIWKSIY